MSDLTRRFERLWPRRGIMATVAGRRVVTDVVALTAASFGVAALVLGLVYALAFVMGLLDNDTVGHLWIGMLGGIAAVAAAFVMLPVLGRLSRLGDDVRLLELCDPGAPLLRELMDRAPGTYQHSIAAGTLAEAAAREIGADPLLTRVGAYYHDIGKSARPHFFVENQIGVRNPHDGARPEQSAFIITAHVREGVEMARRARLPQPLVDIIDQHHGSSLVTYFYRKATASDITVDEVGFRYENSKPRSREAALVMLADAAEAAGRSLVDSGAVAVERAVRRVVGTKVDDGQLSDSGMSEEEVEETVLLYARMLASVRHARVEYPDDPTVEGSDHADTGALEP
jgi:putative nucleotidyltransferase with HDIG domain